jgi:predicted  nucleic acid-binding Zn-ribbon protein
MARGRQPTLAGVEKRIVAHEETKERLKKRLSTVEAELEKLASQKEEIVVKMNDPEFKEKQQESAVKAVEAAKSTLKALGMDDEEIYSVISS